MNKEEAFYIGYLTKTKGLKGEVQLFFEFDNYEQLDLDVLFIDINTKMVPFFVASCKLYENSTGLFYFEEIDHIDKAKSLLKKKVYLPLSKLPERDPDDFTYNDLRGFLVVDENHGTLGEITAVHEYPQQFVAAFLYQETEVLFPLNEDIILEIDEERNTLHVDLPEGLLDIYLKG
ncbi:Ribosome maturation factor RimM [compost metagenome]